MAPTYQNVYRSGMVHWTGHGPDVARATVIPRSRNTKFVKCWICAQGEKGK